METIHQTGLDDLFSVRTVKEDKNDKDCYL